MEGIDNTVAAANARRNNTNNHIMRRLLEARTNKHLAEGWTVHQQYLASEDNDLADALSRQRVQEFYNNAARRGIPASRLRQLRLAGSLHSELQQLLADD